MFTSLDLWTFSQMSVAPESPGVTVVQLSDDQMVQAQGVIQAPQTSVIQSPQVQTVQVRGCDGLCHDLYSYYASTSFLRVLSHLTPLILTLGLFSLIRTKFTGATPPPDQGLNQKAAPLSDKKRWSWS